MNDQLALVLTAIMGGIIAVIAVSFAGLKEYIAKAIAIRIKRMERREYAGGFKLYGEYDRAIEGLRKLTYVDRAIIFVGQNGGGKPTPGQKYTVQAQLGFSKLSDDIPDNYKFIYHVDSHYCVMLQEMLEKGHVINEAKNMPEGSVLKNLYTEEGVVCTIIYYLALIDNALTFISIGSYKEPFTAPQIAKIELFVARLRGLMAQSE